MRNYFATIPGTDLEESARIDGAGQPAHPVPDHDSAGPAEYRHHFAVRHVGYWNDYLGPLILHHQHRQPNPPGLLRGIVTPRRTST
jgi:ABC-type glycerol-3-phosphate transport system permease component